MIDQYRKIFERLNFNFDKDIKLKDLHFQNEDISEKLRDNVYFYESPYYAKTTFYFINSSDLTKTEKTNLHLRIWNENKADLYLIPSNNNESLDIFYVSTLPNKKDRIKITNIPADPEDEKLLEKINKWHFDTGIFWLIYQEKLQDIRKKSCRVDSELINTLRILRKKLEEEYKKVIPEKDERSNIIQALIDRTLFIKFLEDRHINFNGDSNYKNFLKEKNKEKLNMLFVQIHNIFNNVLFDKPDIPEDHLLDSVLDAICDTISHTNLETGQLSLFDFKFDIIPIEFISHIYESFLEEKQAQEGIYYTPEKLVKIIVDDVIEEKQDNIGKVLDPSCGSGIFLVLAFRRLLKNSKIDYNSIAELIDKRNKLLVNNIFGIEKDAIARRLTMFSLYLELLNDIKADEINELIKEKSGKIFPYSFNENIIEVNALKIGGKNTELFEDEKFAAFKNKKFDFIIGNPPWKEAKRNDKEYDYLEEYQETIGGTG